MAATPDEKVQEGPELERRDEMPALTRLVPGSDLPPVLEVIRDRLRTGSLDDGFRVGLSLEGGGMRGVISGAMLIALRDIGAADAIDCYFGTSSGSINLSYFLTGAGWDALAVYYDYLAKGRFFSGRRILRRKAPLDMDYLFDEVMTHNVPLNYEALVRLPPGLLNVTATDVAASQPVLIDRFTDADHAYHFLKGGAWLPVISGRPYLHDGGRYLDSGILLPDPLWAALDSRCTHILVCNTRVQDPHAGHSSFQRRITRRLLNRWSPGLGDLYNERRAEWDAMKAEMGYGESHMRDRRVYRLAPPAGSHQVSRLTTDESTLLEGARAGYAAVLRAFGMANANVLFSLTTHGTDGDSNV